MDQVSRRKSLIDETGDWDVGHQVKTRCDSFREKYAHYIPITEQWWVENTQKSPEKLSFKHRKGNHKIDKVNHYRICLEHPENPELECKQHSMQFQMEGGDEMFKKFSTDHPDVASVSSKDILMSFREYWVLYPTPRSCGCCYHVNFYLAHEVYKKLALEAHKECVCDCEFCENGDGCRDHPCKSSDDMMDHLLCPRTVHGFKLKCVKAECSKCGWERSTLDSCLPTKFEIGKEVEWKQMENVTISEPVADDDTDAYGEKQKVKKEYEKVVHRGTVGEFLKYYMVLSTAFFEHRDTAHWQAKGFMTSVLTISHQLTALS
jgi:hypothetical protein